MLYAIGRVFFVCLLLSSHLFLVCLFSFLCPRQAEQGVAEARVRLDEISRTATSELHRFVADKTMSFRQVMIDFARMQADLFEQVRLLPLPLSCIFRFVCLFMCVSLSFVFVCMSVL